jgi:CDP-diacylglycerol--glycerol-3-phosphate 3-phosphatidyltransferase
MNLPNKITIARMVLTPPFCLLFWLAFTQASKLLSVVMLVFWLIMEYSDIADGQIARKFGLVSDLGKIMDPFSDVISRISYFFLFIQMGFLPAWPLIILFWRELSIVFIRAVLNKAGITLAANKGGKSKAFFYFIVSLLGMFLFVNHSFNFLSPSLLALTIKIAYISFVVATLASVLSFAVYFKGFVNSDYMQKVIKE